MPTTTTGQAVALSSEERDFADRTIAAHSGAPGALLGILERIQEHHPHKYLSSGILELPNGWKEMARSTGALRRARDIPDAESLLRLLLMHVANGYSLAETAARAGELGMNLSAVAVFKRLRASEEWLRWLAEQQRGRQRLAVESQGRPVRAVDATTVSEPGSTGTDWRVHYVVNLANLQCDFFELTGVEGGETLRRIPIRAGDSMMGDRIYATPLGVAHVKAAQADIVVRLNRRSLPLFDAGENQLNVLRLFRKMKVGQVQQWATRVKHPTGGWVPGRLIALKRSAEATRLARRRLEINASKKQKKVSPESWEAAHYFFVWTTLGDGFPAPAASSEVAACERSISRS